MRLLTIRTLSLVFVAVVLLTSCSSKQKDMRKKQSDLYFGAGTQSLMQREYTDALKNLLKANELTPDNSEILTNLAMAYYFKGEKDLAIKTLKRSLELNKNNSDAKTNLASIYFRNRNYPEAERLYKDVLSDLTYEKQARTLYNLGILELTVKKDKVAAENYFKKSIKEDDNYCPAYYHLGHLQFERRQFNSALKNFKEASMGTCYDSPAPHYYQALSLIELRRFDEARLKLDDIETRFKQSAYSAKAREKALEITEIENKKKPVSHASRNVFESPDF